MSISSSTFLLTTGTALLLHAAYSCLHYRLLVRDLQDSGVLIMETSDGPHAATDASLSSHEGTGGASFASLSPSLPPWDVWMEISLAFLTILLSEFCRSGSSLQTVTTSKDNKQQQPQYARRAMAAPLYRSRDFDIYAGRGRAF
jgi:hypothetical protein